MDYVLCEMNDHRDVVYVSVGQNYIFGWYCYPIEDKMVNIENVPKTGKILVEHDKDYRNIYANGAIIVGGEDDIKMTFYTEHPIFPDREGTIKEGEAPRLIEIGTKVNFHTEIIFSYPFFKRFKEAVDKHYETIEKRPKS